CATCDPPTRVLAAAAAPVRTIRLGAARWRRPGAFRAFLSKDALLARRPGPARARLASPWIFGALSVLAWKLPIAPLARASVALALALVAAAGVASWIVALVTSDPFPVVRGLPLGVGVVWGARLAWAAFGALALAAGQALGAGLSPAPSPPASFAGTALVTFAIGALGANYGVTLFPNVDLWRDPIAAKRRLGFASEHPEFYEELSADEYLAFLSAVRGLDPEQAAGRARELYASLGLSERTQEPVRGFSNGMRKKLSFIAAILHRPRVLLCDEALEGFDAPAALYARETLRTLASDGAAVLFSSHVTESVERLCDRVVVIH